VIGHAVLGRDRASRRAAPSRSPFIVTLSPPSTWPFGASLAKRGPASG
jgi:hypothetical protein